MKPLKSKILAVMVSLFMIAAYLPASALPVSADDATEPTISFIGVSGTAYEIGLSLVDELDTEKAQLWKDGGEVDAAPLTDVLAAVGADGDLGDCSYVLEAEDGYSAVLDADWYDSFALFITDTGILRFILLDDTLVQGGWYSPDPLVSITAKDHAYEEGACVNPISVGKGQTEACATVEPSILFIDTKGTEYRIDLSLVDELDTEKAQLWKDGGEVDAAPLTDVLAAIGADEHLGDCSYVLEASDGYQAILDADWLDDFALFITENGILRFILLDETLVQGGWYSPDPLVSITAKDHAYEGGGCANPISVGKGQMEACGEAVPSITFVGISGTEYEIDYALVDELDTETAQLWKDGGAVNAAPLKDVLAAVGADGDLGDCSYLIEAEDGYSAILDADWYDSFALFITDDGILRFILLDDTLVQGGWYSPSPLAMITAIDHVYEEGACVNPISIGKGKTEPCATAIPAITFIGVSGTEYQIDLSLVDELDTSTAQLWKDGGEVDAAYFKDVIAAIGADEDLGDCSYILEAADGYQAIIDADMYDDFGLFITNTGIIRFILMDETLIQGGWYSPDPLVTITAQNHKHGENCLCVNEISNGKNKTEPCGAECHLPGEPVEEPAIPATYAEPGYSEAVVYCVDCQKELSRGEPVESEKSLKDQAADAAAAAAAAAEAAADLTGEAAVAPAQAAVEAAQEAERAAEAALAAAQAEGLGEEVIAEAQAAVNSAEAQTAAAQNALQTKETAAELARSVKETAAETIALLDSFIEESRYTASSYKGYADAKAAFNAVIEDSSATAEQVKAASNAVSAAAKELKVKETQTITATAAKGSVGYASIRSAAKGFELVKASGNVGALSYSKVSGSKAITVNKSTGKITLAKGTAAGTQKAEIKITAAGTDDYFEGATVVSVSVTVTKAKQPMTVKAAKKTVKVSKVKSKAQTVKALTVKKNQGTVTYKKVSGSKNLTINKKTGKITVKKGTKKGTHKIKVKVTAAGNGNYKSGSKTVTVKVQVKK